VLDLHSPRDLKRFRQLSNEVFALVCQFKGSLAAEHGVGIARTEYMPTQSGDGLLEIMREIKCSFDPHNLFNPGKVVPDSRFRIDANLRQGPSHELKLPFAPSLAFAARDRSFIGNLEQCNGCGGCRKESPTMCPTFLVTGKEIMSTRGRANTIRALLSGRGEVKNDILRSAELKMALSNCLSCKACTTECPSNVNLSLLKAELLHAKIVKHGLSWRERLFSSVESLGQLGCAVPEFANATLDSPFARKALEKLLGIASERPLPHYAEQRFDRWFRRRRRHKSPPSRGRVILWDDTFVRYHEPHIGIAAVRVLEAAGYEVALATGRKCCGRPAFSQGHLDKARKLGAHNLALLKRDVDSAPILFLEPSCYSMFVEDYLELGLPGAESIAERCVLLEQFIDHLLSEQRGALSFNNEPVKIVIHAHCHVKSLKKAASLHRLAARLPGREVVLLDSGCCGMAGAFGASKESYELSLKVAEPLIRLVRNQPYGTVIVASGTSCRHQIEHLAPIKPRHMVEVLADALQ
jgi:Fe-S oxidoreductase